MGPALVSQIFFRCLIFNCKKEKLKDKISKKFLKPMEVKSRRKLCPKWLTGFSFSIFNFKYETTVRSSAWSYGHSDPDPDPSSVSRVPFQIDEIFLDVLKFVYSEKATKFCETSTLLLSVFTVDKSKEEISQNFVAFSEYMNFNKIKLLLKCSFLFQPSSPHTSTIVDLCALRRSQTTLIFVNLSEIFSTAKDFHTIMYLIGTLLRRYVTKVHSF